jgi:hypothetical protein
VHPSCQTLGVMKLTRLPMLVLAAICGIIGVLLVGIFGIMSVAALIPTPSSSGAWVGMLRQTLAGLLVGFLLCGASFGLVRERRWVHWPFIGILLAALALLMLAMPNVLRMYELDYTPSNTKGLSALADWRLYSLLVQNYEYRLYFFVGSLLLAVFVCLRTNDA